MEGKIVMLINPVVMTTFNFTILLLYYYYYISRMLPYQKIRRECVIFFQPRALLQTYKEIFADFDIDESSNYIRHVI